MASEEWEQQSGGAPAAVKEKGQQLVSEAQQQVQEKAGEAKDQASARLREQVERRSTIAGEQIGAVGSALRKSSEQLRAEGKDAPATAVEQAAKRAESLGSYFRDSNADQIIRDVEAFARRRPWLVGTAGMIAGFAASRFLKASSQQRYETSAYEPMGYGGYVPSRGTSGELTSGAVR